MASKKTNGTWLLFAICLLACPLLALGLASTSAETPIPSTSRAESLASSFTNLDRDPMLLTSSQLANLRKDPANAFLSAESDQLALDYSDPGEAEACEGVLWAVGWLEELQLKDRIHEIKVNGWGSLTNFTSLSLGIQSLNRLDELHWQNNDPLPQSILSVVKEFHPDCKIFYDMKFSNWDPYDHSVPSIQAVGEEPHRKIRAQKRRLILKSNNLYSLKTDVGYGADPDPVSLRLVHEILTTCPNLRHLDLSIGHEGCVISGNQPYAFDFSGKMQLAKSSFPPLETLRLSGYDLDGPYHGEDWPPLFTRPDRSRLKWPWYYLPEFILQTIPPDWSDAMEKEYEPESQPSCPTTFNHTTNLDGWLERMDFSKLLTLDVDGISSTTLHKLRPVLTNLASLKIRGADACAADSLESLLQNATVPLNSLRLADVRFNTFNSLFDAITSRHNESVYSLTLHEGEEFRRHSCWCSSDRDHPNCENESRPHEWYDDHLYLTTTQLEQLQQSSPYLMTLDIDLNRNLSGLAQDEFFEAIGSFADLQKLTLRLESPTFQAIRNGAQYDRWNYRHEPLIDPMVNKTWVKDVFRRIHSAQPAQPWWNSSGGDSSSTRPSDWAPMLSHIEVIIGPWSARHQNGMVPPEKFVLGRFECTAQMSPESLGTRAGDSVEERYECTGGITWPDEYMYGYMPDGGLDPEIDINDEHLLDDLHHG